MHHFLALFWFCYFHYLLGSLIGAFAFLVAFALFGIETGIHRKYVAILLATFEVSILLPISLSILSLEPLTHSSRALASLPRLVSRCNTCTLLPSILLL